MEESQYGVMACGNNLGRKEEEPQTNQELDKGQLRLQKKWGHGKRLRRDPPWSIKVKGDRGTCKIL